MLANKLAMTIVDLTDDTIVLVDDNSDRHLIPLSVSLDKELNIGDKWIVDTYGKARYMLYQRVDNSKKSVSRYNMIVDASEILGRERDFINDVVASGVDGVSIVVLKDSVIHFDYSKASDIGLKKGNDITQLVIRLKRLGYSVNLLIHFNSFGANKKYCQQDSVTVHPYIGMQGVYAINHIINEIAEKYIDFIAGIGFIGARYIGDNSQIAKKAQDKMSDLEFASMYIPILCNATGATICIFEDTVYDGYPLLNGLYPYAPTDNTRFIGVSGSSADIPYLLSSNSHGSAVATKDFKDVLLLSNNYIKDIYLFYDDFKSNRYSGFKESLVNARVLNMRNKIRIGFYYDGISIIDGQSVTMEKITQIIDVINKKLDAEIMIVTDASNIDLFDIFIVYNAININQNDIDNISRAMENSTTRVIMVGKIWYNNKRMPFANLFGKISTSGTITTKPMSYVIGDCDYGIMNIPTLVFIGVNDSGNNTPPIFSHENSRYIGIDTENTDSEVVIAMIADMIVGSNV